MREGGERGRGRGMVGKEEREGREGRDEKGGGRRWKIRRREGMR